jgi:hypothetical protein
VGIRDHGAPAHCSERRLDSIAKQTSRPAQIVLAQRQGTNALARRHLDGVEDRRRYERHDFLADAGNPSICL